jgi:hypothetical protein
VLEQQVKTVSKSSDVTQISGFHHVASVKQRRFNGVETDRGCVDMSKFWSSKGFGVGS